MQIQVNGDGIELQDNATLVDLIDHMALTGKRIAIELNMEIVPRSEHGQTVLKAGDLVEVVHAIGGG